MAVRTTRTLNPLPFQDLEPHRFEDLVRQLAYEFRDWQALEAIGRSGSDEGVDIRGLETVKTPTLPPDDDENDEGATTAARVWIFQCKREKAMGPKKVRATVEESLPKAGANNVHGFVLAAGCNLSKKARDAFREEMVVRGVQEFFVWSRSELEDMLFQPQHDRLLFAYFGISLAPRRRSLGTLIRREVALKKQLARLFDDDQRENAFLLRDPTDDRYPDDCKDRRWQLCSFRHARSPGLMAFVAEERLAWVSAAADSWDRIPGYNHLPWSLLYVLRQENAWGLDRPREDGYQHVRDFWNEYVDETRKALLRIIYFAPISNIVAIDPLGDGYFPIPHVHMLYEAGEIPFTFRRAVLRRPTGMRTRVGLDPEQGNQVTFFPDPLPASASNVPNGFGLSISKRKSRASKAILQRVAELEPSESPKGATSPPTAVSEEAVNADFRAWRDDVVVPVFGGVAHRLREGGHRVWVRQLEAHDAWRGAEVIELRCDLRGCDGHVRYELVRGDAVKTEIRPFGRTFERDDEPRTIASMTSESVEADIAKMFDRIES